MPPAAPGSTSGRCDSAFQDAANSYDLVQSSIAGEYYWFLVDDLSEGEISSPHRGYCLVSFARCLLKCLDFDGFLAATTGTEQDICKLGNLP